jgi:hypothetical protein
MNRTLERLLPRRRDLRHVLARMWALNMAAVVMYLAFGAVIIGTDLAGWEYHLPVIKRF